MTTRSHTDQPPTSDPPDSVDGSAASAEIIGILDTVTIPIVVQDHPASSNVWMSTAVIASIAAAAPQCRVVKLEEDPSPPKIRRLLAQSPDSLVLGGLGAMLLIEELRAGARGTMTGFGYPEMLVEIVSRWQSGDLAGARAAFYRIAPLVRFENQQGLSLGIRKEIYRRRGAMRSAHVRAPGAQIDPETTRDLEYLLEHLRLSA